MFGKTKTVQTTTVIELSDSSKQALSALDSDLQVISQLLEEVCSNTQKIIGQLASEVISNVPTASEEGTGVEVFSEAETASGDRYETRVRSSPFNRRPRTEQVQWLLSIMQPNQWYNAVTIGKQYSSDSRELRYLRSSINGRFREMMEDGLVVRRQSELKGNFYDYRLK